MIEWIPGSFFVWYLVKKVIRPLEDYTSQWEIFRAAYQEEVERG